MSAINTLPLKRSLAALGAVALGLTLILTPNLQSDVPPVQAAESCPADGRHLLPVRGGLRYLSGVNVPWYDYGYGADFATVEEWGQHTYSSAATDRMFAELAAKGVNSVRWWVFADGRGAPEFASTSGGAVTGFDATTLPSLADAAQLAAKHNLLLVLTLWSSDMLLADSTPQGRGEHAGGHRDLIVDGAKRKSFIDKALIPLLRYPVPDTAYTLGTHPNIYGWEVMNEPEYAISEMGSPTQGMQPVLLAEMQRFVAEVAGTIHRNSNQTVTVGSAAMKWNSDGGLGTDGNWWKDSALTQYDPQGYLDYYQIHYYGWMNGDGVNWSYSPLRVSWQAGAFDKPVVIGEHPANAGWTELNVDGMLAGFLGNCYAGAWAWSYAGVDDSGGWSDMATAISRFNSANAALVKLPPARVVDRTTLTNKLFLPLTRR